MGNPEAETVGPDGRDVGQAVLIANNGRRRLFMRVNSCVAAGILAGLALISGPPALAGIGGVGIFRDDAAVDRSVDETMIRRRSEEFTQAFNGGKAAALASLMTEEARLVGPDGATVGKAQIQGWFESLFGAEPGMATTATIDVIRFVTDDVAIEEGRSTERSGLVAVSNVYLAIWVRKDGTWKIAELRDFREQPGDRTPRERLEALGWLVGDWIDEADDGLVETECRWSDDGNYLIRSYTLKVADQAVMSGTQRIGWDASRKQFRSWAHDSNGGFAEGVWSRDGEGRWLVKAEGVLPDGQTVTSTQVYTRVSDHSVRYESYDQTVGDEQVGGEVDVRLVRRPPVPASEPKVDVKTNETRQGSSK